VSGNTVSPQSWDALVQRHGPTHEPVLTAVRLALTNGRAYTSVQRSSGVEEVDRIICDWLQYNWHPKLAGSGIFALRRLLDIAHQRVSYGRSV
jgi:hypothetical protein